MFYSELMRFNQAEMLDAAEKENKERDYLEIWNKINERCSVVK